MRPRTETCPLCFQPIWLASYAASWLKFAHTVHSQVAIWMYFIVSLKSKQKYYNAYAVKLLFNILVVQIFNFKCVRVQGLFLINRIVFGENTINRSKLHPPPLLHRNPKYLHFHNIQGEHCTNLFSKSVDFASSWTGWKENVA